MRHHRGQGDFRPKCSSDRPQAGELTTGTIFWSLIIHKLYTSSISTRNHVVVSQPSVQPISDAIGIGIELSSDSGVLPSRPLQCLLSPGTPISRRLFSFSRPTRSPIADGFMCRFVPVQTARKGSRSSHRPCASIRAFRVLVRRQNKFQGMHDNCGIAHANWCTTSSALKSNTLNLRGEH